jgi:hypothetical protein
MKKLLLFTCILFCLSSYSQEVFTYSRCECSKYNIFTNDFDIVDFARSTEVTVIIYKSTLQIYTDGVLTEFTCGNARADENAIYFSDANNTSYYKNLFFLSLDGAVFMTTYIDERNLSNSFNIIFFKY